MRREKNEAGGISIILEGGDNLSKVPKSHRDLLTPAIRAAFDDPNAHFRRVAERTPFPSMAAWLEALVADGDWELALHRGNQPGWEAAGFGWWPEGTCGAEVAPSEGDVPSTLPPALREYYALVGGVSWMPFGIAGGLYGCCDHSALNRFNDLFGNEEFDPATTFSLGSDLCGDMLVYTRDGRGGWLFHERLFRKADQIHPLGSIEDALNWAFGELLADRRPEAHPDWR